MAKREREGEMNEERETKVDSFNSEHKK